MSDASSAHATVVHQPTPVSQATTVDAATAPSVPPVELVGHTTSEDQSLLRFYRGRAKLFTLINLACWSLLLGRELTTAGDAFADTRITIFAAALVVQALLTLIVFSSWVKSVAEYSGLGLCCAMLFAAVIASIQFATLRRPELTSHVFAPEVRTVIGVHYANGWALMWFVIIFLDSMVYPRTVRRTLIAGIAVGVIALGVCLAAYLANGALAAADLRVLILQTLFWTTLGTALGVICQYRLETLQAQAEKAKRFGQYKLTRKLEAGGMGEVHLAEHLLLKRRCSPASSAR